MLGRTLRVVEESPMITQGIIYNLKEAAEFLKTIEEPVRCYRTYGEELENRYLLRVLSKDCRIENGVLHYFRRDGVRTATMLPNKSRVYLNYWLVVADSLQRYGKMPILVD